jgi:predicted amidophosphoribosyltransferase
MRPRNLRLPHNGWMSLVEELVNFLLPTRCSLCQAIGAALCRECDLKFEGLGRPVSRGSLQGWAATSYSEDSARLITAFKEEGQTSLAGSLAAKLRAGFSYFGEQCRIDSGRTLLAVAPSRKENAKLRGYHPVKILAKRFIKSAGVELELYSGLRFIREVQDQARLSTADRAANLGGSMAVADDLSGRTVLLIDDIVTTGATILEARRALEAAGARVVGFLAFSETILKTRTKN